MRSITIHDDYEFMRDKFVTKRSITIYIPFSNFISIFLYSFKTTTNFVEVVLFDPKILNQPTEHT